jgi:hypothetical protein
MKKKLISPDSAMRKGIAYLLGLLLILGCQKQSTPLDPGKLKPLPTTTIVYSNLDQDTLITGLGEDTAFALDLNNDGIPDFKFTKQVRIYRTCTGNPDAGSRGMTRVYIGFIRVSPLNNNAISGYSISADSVFPFPLSDLALISSSATGWSDSINQIINVYAPATTCNRFYQSGLFLPENLDDTTAFLGLRLALDSNNYYGWVKISLVWSRTVSGVAGFDLRVMGCAYNKSPGEAIYAGELR